MDTIQKRAIRNIIRHEGDLQKHFVREWLCVYDKPLRITGNTGGSGIVRIGYDSPLRNALYVHFPITGRQFKYNRTSFKHLEFRKMIRFW